MIKKAVYQDIERLRLRIHIRLKQKYKRQIEDQLQTFLARYQKLMLRLESFKESDPDGIVEVHREACFTYQNIIRLLGGDRMNGKDFGPDKHLICPLCNESELLALRESDQTCAFLNKDGRPDSLTRERYEYEKIDYDAVVCNSKHCFFEISFEKQKSRS